MISPQSDKSALASGAFAGIIEIGVRRAADYDGDLPQARLARIGQLGCSLADQVLSVGGMFLVNLALARTLSREEYGRFALSYSALIFFLGLQNAAILEPFTIYGSGRYRPRFKPYFRLIFWSNAGLGLLLTALMVGGFLVVRWTGPHLPAQTVIGPGVTVSFLFSGALLRRAFYLQRRPALAALASLIFFLTVVVALGVTAKLHALDNVSVFFVLAAGWLVAGLTLGTKLPFGKTGESFLDSEPCYWREHWNYSRWVLATAFVFQLTTQGYYWLVASFLSVKDVAELKAMSLIVAPADQIFIALNYLVLPVLCTHYAVRRMKELRAAWRLYAVAISAMTFSFFLVIRAVGGRLTHLLYRGRYDDAAPLLSMLSLVPMVMGVGHTMNAALKATESPRLVFWAYVCSGAVTFAVGTPLVARFGVRGAVYGMLVSGGSYTAALAVGLAATFRRESSSAVVPAAN